VDEVLNRAVFRRYRRTATFAFVDPCGLKGLYVADIAKILSLPFGECLVFLNYDGLNRWVGGVRAATHARDKLDQFFGAAAAADAALACISAASPKRESCLLDTYLRAISETTRARFVLPFRFRASTRDRTSHYLIHLSQHPLAFTIMKEVMKAESAPTEDLGSFGFIPPDKLIDQGQLRCGAQPRSPIGISCDCEPAVSGLRAILPNATA
jgi:three-Cys-motif partner protein